MNIKNFKISYKDDRGIIKDLIQKKKLTQLLILQSIKIKLEENHYHKKTTQWNYILSGKLKVFTKQKKSRLKVKIFEKGSFFILHRRKCTHFLH